MRVLFNHFALSRAGAVAAVVAGKRFRAVLPVTIRLALLVAGAVAIGFGAAATLATGLGPGPFDVLVSGISNMTGLSFALSLWLLAGVLAAVATALGRRPGVGTLAAPMIIGPVIQVATGWFQALLPYSADAGFAALWADGPGGVAVTVAAHLSGVAVIGLGAGALITSGLGAGTGDLVAAATSSKLGRSQPLVRTGLELSWLGIGLTFGGAAGIGTILVALTIGPAVRFGHAGVDMAVTGTLGQPLPAATGSGQLGRSVGQLRDRVLESVNG